MANGRGLRAADGDNSDSKAVVKFNKDEKFVTKVIKSLNPDWNQAKNIPIDCPKSV